MGDLPGVPTGKTPEGPRRHTTARNLPRKCKRCGQETLVNIEAPEPASKVTSA